MSFTNFGTGHSHSFESKFVELVPGERIRLADTFDDPGLAGDMTKTITLRTVMCGTEIEILHEGLPAAIPAEMCYLGWQESLVQLANLVEPAAAGFCVDPVDFAQIAKRRQPPAQGVGIEKSLIDTISRGTQHAVESDGV